MDDNSSVIPKVNSAGTEVEDDTELERISTIPNDNNDWISEFILILEDNSSIVPMVKTEIVLDIIEILEDTDSLIPNDNSL